MTFSVPAPVNRAVSNHPYPLIFATVSGAHLYGFASPDSDWDLRGVHLLPADEVLGLFDPQETIEQERDEDGVELDLVTHDARKFFALLLKRNGYVLEQLYSPLVVHTSPEHEELKHIAKGCITRYHSHHYLGFAATQWELFEKEQPRRIKPLLYTYRVLLTGIHLMRTGNVEANLQRLNDEFRMGNVSELIARKSSGREHSTLADADADAHRREYDRLRTELESASERSHLPEAPSARAALSDLLVRLRHSTYDHAARRPAFVKITIPELSLVVLIGPSGCGKSSFARAHFKPTEVLSSDFCRGLVSDDENAQAATNDAFDVLHYITRKRIAAGRLTVVDATNVQAEARKPLVALAREFHVLPVAIVLNMPEKLCHERNRNRHDRQFGPHVVRNQSQQLRRSIRGLEREGFRHVFVLSSPEEVSAVAITRQPLWNNLKHEHGPFDIVGDVHGCYEELTALLGKLGYRIESGSELTAIPPDGRKAVFVGDLVDRGPKTPEVLRLVMNMVHAGTAFCVPGNHDTKLVRKLKGRDVQLTHGLADSIEQLDRESPEFKQQVLKFLDDLVSHYVFDDGELVVAHAGMKEEMQGRGSGKVRDFALYGETTGETDEYGLPVRYNWAAEYRGKAIVVYGHTPVSEPEWLNRTINIDTGCVFGGKLTALRYPERELVSVPALRTYYEPAKPFLKQEEPAPALTAQQQLDDLLDIEDVIGKRIIHTRLHRNITIREENATAALEVMSRFAANPKWLIYLPPTMSPCETSKRDGLLEHPEEAFSYYFHEGVHKVVCEQKHMGSRAVVVVCRDADAARKRFGVIEGETGVCYTRTGRRFFNEPSLESQFLDRICRAVGKAGVWEDLKADWVCLDCELMPWSAKAQELLRQQYAPTGAAARASLPAVIKALSAAQANTDVAALLEQCRQREEVADLYVEAYRRYCWTVHSLTDLKLAPFHLLASEGAVHTTKDHLWHMETLARICGADQELLLATPFQVVDLTNRADQEKGVVWWEELTARGGEGMVVKPLDFVAKGRKGLSQPAVKVRGREYLRIIYGAEYTLHDNLQRLKSRGLGAKRSLALREFALALEALERFVHQEPLRRVHECVFGVLALESEPVDPRL